MRTITSTDAATGQTTTHRVNDTLSVGQAFRLIGSTTVFIATRITQHKVAGPMVIGRTADNRIGTGARICDTLAI